MSSMAENVEQSRALLQATTSPGTSCDSTWDAQLEQSTPPSRYDTNTSLRSAEATSQAHPAQTLKLGRKPANDTVLSR